MEEKYNIEELNKFIKTHKNGESICRWFNNMASEYHKLRKEGKVTDELKIRLMDFWEDISMTYGDTIFQMLNVYWADRKIDMISDFAEFTDRYHEIKLSHLIDIMDEIEKSESESLFETIWNKDRRTEVNFNFFDYDEDDFIDLSFSLPRKGREEYRSEFRKLCAKNIYNRGSMFIKFFGKRGSCEYTAIRVDEDGYWSCLTEAEIAGNYSTEDNEPFTLKKNERVLVFDHRRPSIASENQEEKKVIKFNPKYS